MAGQKSPKRSFEEIFASAMVIAFAIRGMAFANSQGIVTCLPFPVNSRSHSHFLKIPWGGGGGNPPSTNNFPPKKKKGKGGTGKRGGGKPLKRGVGKGLGSQRRVGTEEGRTSYQ